MRMTFKLPAVFVPALAAVALVFLTACEAPPPAPPVTLRVGVFPVQSFLPYYVMREQGFDKKYGLRFEETSYAGGTAVIDAMAAGALDLGPAIATVPLLMAAERGVIPDKLVPVAANNVADREHPGVAVIVAHSVQGWKNLEGGKIGTPARRSLSTSAVEIRLHREGVNDYSFVEIPTPNLGLAVAGGNVVAAAMDEPFLTQSLLRGDGKLLGWVVGGPPLERMTFSMIVVSTEFRRRNPEGVKAYLRAHLDAAKWINEHPDEARRLLAKRQNLSPEVAKNINLMRWPLDARTDPVLLDQTQQVLFGAGLLKRAIDTRTLHDETLLAEVLKEKR